VRVHLVQGGASAFQQELDLRQIGVEPIEGCVRRVERFEDWSGAHVLHLGDERPNGPDERHHSGEDNHEPGERGAADDEGGCCKTAQAAASPPLGGLGGAGAGAVAAVAVSEEGALASAGFSAGFSAGAPEALLDGRESVT
jgi:hypothetical protein